LLFSLLFAKNVEYYGLIEEYPITMELDIKFSVIRGAYFYNSQKKDIILSGKIKEDKINLFVKNKDGVVTEKFLLFATDTTRTRLVGNWFYKGKKLKVELRTDELINKIDPIQDGEIDKYELMAFPEFIFDSCYLSGTSGIYVDIGCGLVTKDYMKTILEIVKEIRSEIWEGSYSCIVFFNHSLNLLKFSFYPERYNFGSVKRPPEHHNRVKNYFLRWSFQSVYTYDLYIQFWDEFRRVVHPNLLNYYRQMGLSDSDAQRIISNLLFEILDRAAGSYPSASDLDKMYPLLSAVIEDKSNSEIEELLKSYDQESLIEPFRAAILLDRGNSLIKIFAKEIDINLKFGSYLSCASDNLGKTKLLLDLGADPNGENYFGKTPLYYAIQVNNLEVVKMLIENGSKVNDEYYSRVEERSSFFGSPPFRYGRTPLMHAAQHSDMDIVKYLVHKGADINAIDNEKDKAVDYAKRFKKDDIAAFLEDVGKLPATK